MNSVNDQKERKKQTQAKTMFSALFLFWQRMRVPMKRERANPEKDRTVKILMVPPSMS